MTKTEEKLAPEQPNLEQANLEQEISEIEILKKENEDLKNKIAYLAAESHNTTKRLKNEFDEKMKYSISKFASDLIDPIEVLFLALDNISAEHLEEGGNNLKNLHQGVDMTKLEFLKAFEKHGMQRIFPLNEKFDHNFHQAVSQVKVEGFESNVITQVLKAGYVLNGRVIRPAIVVVSS